MKPVIARGIIAVLALSAFGASAFAGPHRTEIITSTSSPLVINVADAVFLKISNFTQEGGSARGTVTVTINGQSANVLTASQINTTSLATPLEEINRVVIAGPATVTVAPVPGATLFITFRREREREGKSQPAAPTPTPTATATATPTPTATPTATP
jgi:hypothetical protein